MNYSAQCRAKVVDIYLASSSSTGLPKKMDARASNHLPAQIKCIFLSLAIQWFGIIIYTKTILAAFISTNNVFVFVVVVVWETFPLGLGVYQYLLDAKQITDLPDGFESVVTI